MASDAGRSIGLVIARVGMAALFIYTGALGIQHPAHTANSLAAMGYPAPSVLAVVAALAQLAGGVSLVLGLLTPLGCIALILFLLPTTYSFHVPGLLKGDPRQTIDALKNLALIGGLVTLAFSGPGRFSVDVRARAKRQVQS